MEAGLPNVRYGKREDRSTDYVSSQLFYISVSSSSSNESRIELSIVRGGAWYAITVRCPGAEVDQLASFRAEGAPGIAFPRGGLVTEGAGHVRQYIMPNLRIGQRLTRLDLGRGGDLQ